MLARLRGQQKQTPGPCAQFPDIELHVTYRRPNGAVATETVCVNGGNLLTDAATLARFALRDRQDIACSKILNISLPAGDATDP